MKPEPCLTRVCWNTENWMRPSGTAKEKKTYYAKMGFGHEEWLFEPSWVLNGWRYSFLQPVNNSWVKMQGCMLDAKLYAISPEKTRFYIGQIRECRVLTEAEAEVARKGFAHLGWLRKMVAQVKLVNGNVAGLEYKEAHKLFNIRFRPSQAELYSSPILVGEQDAIQKISRYTLIRDAKLNRRVTRERDRRKRAASTRPFSTGQRPRAGQAATKIELIHNEMQNTLISQLVARYGPDAVKKEERHADIKILRKGRLTLVEIKSDPRPSYAIREALGQLLHYAFECEQTGEPVADMIVVGRSKLGNNDQGYLDYLQNRLGLQIQYIQFHPELTL